MLPHTEPLSCQLWDYIQANEDFYFEKKKSGEKTDKPIPVQMYLTMSNYRSVTELVRLWRAYIQNKDFSFPYGMAELKHIFNLLHDIRFWNEQRKHQGLNELTPDQVYYSKQKFAA